jgi:hypothetical protein
MIREDFKKSKFADLSKEYTGILNQRYMYLDKNLSDKGGIDYSQFIQLRFQTINSCHIRDIYSVEGWYLLFVMMIQANKYCFLKTTINMLYEDGYKRVTTINIKKILLKLNREGIIKLSKVKSINVNTPLEIIIPYNNNDLYQFKEGKWSGFKAIPVDLIRLCLKILTPGEWSVFCVLAVRWADYTVTPSYMEDEESYVYKRNHYAFPDNRQISECIGKSKTQTNRYINQLVNNSSGIVKMYSSGKSKMKEHYNIEGEIEGNKAPNSIYFIPLFERIEYIYYHIIKVDNRPEEQRISNIIKFEEIAHSSKYKSLTKSDYYLSYYDSLFEKYKSLLESGNKEGYKSFISCYTCKLENCIDNIAKIS